eukprot:119082_1
MSSSPPTLSPTVTYEPSSSPSANPIISPTKMPSFSPSLLPIMTNKPTISPTEYPINVAITVAPSNAFIGSTNIGTSYRSSSTHSPIEKQNSNPKEMDWLALILGAIVFVTCMLIVMVMGCFIARRKAERELIRERSRTNESVNKNAFGETAIGVAD